MTNFFVNDKLLNKPYSIGLINASLPSQFGFGSTYPFPKIPYPFLKLTFTSYAGNFMHSFSTHIAEFAFNRFFFCPAMSNRILNKIGSTLVPSNFWYTRWHSFLVKLLGSGDDLGAKNHDIIKMKFSSRFTSSIRLLYYDAFCRLGFCV